jgi:RNA polymerase sigma factor (sigma-70 family)
VSVAAGELNDLLRSLAPQVLGTLLRRYRNFDVCEDALQEALLAAATHWPADGVPQHPPAWLVTVASRRLVDQVRGEQARRRREAAVASREPSSAMIQPAPDVPSPQDRDDTLALLFMCCHPALTPATQVALTLRAVGGLTTAEIARAFLVPEATMASRISRAKQNIRAAGAAFDMPEGKEYAERLDVVLQVLYLIFNEGYTATVGPDLQRADLAAEAIRLTRTMQRALPDDGEIAGLLALMLLTHARRAARTDAHGGLVPLSDQDRGRWDEVLAEEGTQLVVNAMRRSPLGPYQLQAAIVSLHMDAAHAEDTDWPQIRFLYQVLCRIAPNPMASLNHAVAVAMTDGPAAGLAMLREIGADHRVAGHHRLAAVRAHLLELAGDRAAAREDYLIAARRTSSLPEQRYLRLRANQLAN